VSDLVRVGVLALQGDFLEHVELLREMGIEAVYVKNPSDLERVDALIIPGGESTTIASLVKYRGLAPAITKFSEDGKPIMGTCAGSILLAKRVVDRVVGETGQFTIGLMNISVVRNAFGRQNDSFEAVVNIEGIGEVKAAFIRAPVINEAWPPAKITGYINHPVAGKVGVSAEQGSLIALTFHPEITGEVKIYRYFIDFIRK
jgi:5'-phosphate synthase pdxT subunit